MAETGDAGAREREEVLDLVAEAMEEFATGGEPALASFCGQLTRHREAVLTRLQTLRSMGMLDDPAVAATAAPIAVPQRLGDFELLERLGAGGMGVVYRARQVSLDREVALKLVRPDQLLFPGVRERFQREVAIIARLQHEGIVRLYSFGEDQGIPWFAMERIDGISLAEVLQRLAGRRARDLLGTDVLACLGPPPGDAGIADLFAGNWLDTCVRIVERAALALAEAHAQGVLHRDLKPSNIMFTRTGRVVLLDFGLAFAHGVDRLTRSGAQVGTIHYMAPEQVRSDANAVDERTDVYALGVVLRELLSLQPAFDGSSADIIAQRVQQGTPTPLDRRAAAITWETETVCLVAMDPDPARRYRSATALARDLRHLLAHESIEAARPGLPRRLRRFAQRHRAVSIAAAVVGATLLALPLVVAWRERGLRQQLERSNDELAAEVRRTNANLELAAQAVSQTLERIESERVLEVPDLRAFADAVTKDSTAFLEALVARNPADPAARLELAKTLALAGQARWRFQQLDQARPIFAHVVELLTDCPGDQDVIDELELSARRALTFVSRTAPEAATAAYRGMLDRVRRHGEFASRPAPVRAAVALTLEWLASSLRARDRVAALTAIDESIALRRAVAAEQPSAVAWCEVARGLRQRRELLPRENVAERVAIDRDREAVLRLALAQPTPEPAGLDDLMVTVRLFAGDVAAEDHATRIEWLRVCARLHDQLVAPRPSRVASVLDLAVTRNRLADALFAAGHQQEALTECRRVLADLMRWVAIWPDEVPLRSAVAGNRLRIAQALASADDARDQVRRELDLALADVEPLLATTNRASTWRLVMLLRHERSRFAARTGDLPTALVESESACQVREQYVQLARQQNVGEGATVEIALQRIEILLRLDRGDEALALLAAEPWLPANLLAAVPALRERSADERFAAQLARVRKN